MTVSIIPGYDFGVNEVPNRETLLRQARLMKISGIGLDEIDATLVGIKAGQTSGTTSSSLPAPGWMWGDPEGSLWVETDHGPVKLKRAGGGWESVRWGQTFSPQVPIPRSGDAWEPAPTSGTGTHTDGIQLPVGASGAMDMWDMIYVDSDGGCVGSRSAMLCAESVPTTASFPRLVGRGIALIHIRGTRTHADFCVRTPGGFRTLGTGAAEWNGAFVTTDSNNILDAGSAREQWLGTFLSPHSGTSFQDDGVKLIMKGDCFGWKFDLAIAGPGAGI